MVQLLHLGRHHYLIGAEIRYEETSLDNEGRLHNEAFCSGPCIKGDRIGKILVEGEVCYWLYSKTLRRVWNGESNQMYVVYSHRVDEPIACLVAFTNLH